MTWANFTFEEFACKCGKCINQMQPTYIDKLQSLRDSVGFPLIVTSGYRCPTYNQRVSTTGLTGPHTTGRAADLLVDRIQAFHVMKAAIEAGFTGFGFQQKGTVRFIHLDDLLDRPTQPRPTIWSY